MSWGADEEALPAGGDAGSTIDNVLAGESGWWVRIRKFLAIVLTDTSDVALGAGADEDNPKIKDDCVVAGSIADDAVEAGCIADDGVVAGNIADDAVDENAIAAATLGAGLAGGGGTTLSVDGMTGTGITELKCKVVDIGDWDMNADHSISVAHGLTLAKIRSVVVTIRKDDNSTYYDLCSSQFTAFGVYEDSAGGIDAISATYVNLRREASGVFDSADFDDFGGVAGNRGWITIWYEA